MQSPGPAQPSSGRGAALTPPSYPPWRDDRARRDRSRESGLATLSLLDLRFEAEVHGVACIRSACRAKRRTAARRRSTYTTLFDKRDIRPPPNHRLGDPPSPEATDANRQLLRAFMGELASFYRRAGRDAGIRTRTGLLPSDFKSDASADFATSPCRVVVTERARARSRVVRDPRSAVEVGRLRRGQLAPWSASPARDDARHASGSTHAADDRRR